MQSTKRIGFNSNSHTENGYTFIFWDFEYSHLIIIKTIYSLENKESTAFLNASTRQSILKLKDYYTCSTWTACLLGLLQRLTYTGGT